MNQFEIWRAKPEGFTIAHYFVIISSPARIAQTVKPLNGLCCYTQRGPANPNDVLLNGADDLDTMTACDCSYFFVLPRNCLLEKKGVVSFERQTQIKAKVRSQFRL